MKKLTVSIGIPAHNEEANIKKLLHSILRQYLEPFYLNEILVLSDKSTDKTEKIVKELEKKHKKIKLLRSDTRVGKSKRLSAFFKYCISDIVVLLDGDTVLDGKRCLENVVKEFMTDKRIGLVALCDRPFRAKTSTQKTIVTGIKLWSSIKEEIDHGKSIHNIHGCGYALARSVYKDVTIPIDIFNDDEFMYHYTKSKKALFSHVCDARIRYYAPKTASDFIKQSIRFSNSREKIFEYFGENIASEYAYSPFLKYKYTLKYFFSSPFYVLSAFALQILYRVLQGRYYQNYALGYWDAIKSTKMPSLLTNL